LYSTLKTKSLDAGVSVNQTNTSLMPGGTVKVSKSDCRRLDGRLFHNRGPATLLAHLPPTSDSVPHWQCRQLGTGVWLQSARMFTVLPVYLLAPSVVPHVQTVFSVLSLVLITSFTILCIVLF